MKRKERGKKALNKREKKRKVGGETDRVRKDSLFELSAVQGGRREGEMMSEGERKRKKFNLLKILQIAPVHNSPKLPTNQGRVPITLPLHGDQITL